MNYSIILFIVGLCYTLKWSHIICTLFHNVPYIMCYLAFYGWSYQHATSFSFSRIIPLSNTAKCNYTHQVEAENTTKLVKFSLFI